MKKEIAFFDFDGTITTKDTLLAFIKFSKGNFCFFLGFLLKSHYLIAYKLKIISNQSAKEKVLQFFFKNTSVETFNEYCTTFAKTILPKLLRPKALSEIQKLQQNGCIVVVVSASPENWISHWAAKAEVQVLASKLEVKDGKITGRILGKNCHGNEKVRRILEKYVVKDYGEVYAYGDSKGDLPMLKLATRKFYKPFV